MSIPVDDPTALSRLYHLNSEPWLNQHAYRGAPYVQETRTYHDAPRHSLRAWSFEMRGSRISISHPSPRPMVTVESR